MERRNRIRIDQSVNAFPGVGHTTLFIEDRIAHGMVLQGKEAWPHEIGTESLHLQPTGVLGADVFSLMTDEFESKRIRNYYLLKARLQRARQARRDVKSQLSKAAFNAIVRRRTYYYSKRVWTGRYLEEELRQPQRRVTDYETKYISNMMYYSLRLRTQTGLSAEQRKSLEASRNWYREHPEMDAPDARTWRTPVGWHWGAVGVTSIPGLEPQIGQKKRRSKIYTRKTVQYKDWSAIRADWLRKRSSVASRLAVIQRTIDLISDRMRNYLPSWSRPDLPLQSHECTAVKQNTPLTTERAIGSISFDWDGTQQGFRDAITLWLDAGNGSRVFRSCNQDPYPAVRFLNRELDGVSYLDHYYYGPSLNIGAEGSLPGGNLSPSDILSVAENAAEFATGYFLPVLFADDEETSSESANALLKFLPMYPQASRRWGFLLRKDHHNLPWVMESCTQDAGLGVFPTDAQGLRVFTKDTDLPSTTTIIADDSFDSPVSYETRARNSRIVAYQRLSNLDIHSDDIEWDYVRSVGELRDLPSSVTTLANFALFLESAKSRTYYEIVGDGPRRVTFRKPVGLAATKFVRRRISAAATLAQLASLYLAWKFGLEQTLADTDQLARYVTRGWNGIRSGLSLIYSHLDGGKRFHPLRRRWSLGHPLLPRSPRTRKFLENGIWKKAVIPQSVQVEIPALGDDQITVTSTLDFDAAIQAVLSGEFEHLTKAPGTNIPVVFSDDGLVVAPISLCYKHSDIWSDHDQELAASWSRTESQRRIFAVIKDRFGSDSELHIRKVTKGVVYANYAYKTLSRALRWSWRNRLAYTGFTVAWELAPLSFVVEWLTNIRQLIDSANAMLSRTWMMINPTGKVWESIQTRYWYSALRRRTEFSWGLMAPDAFTKNERTIVVAQVTKPDEDGKRWKMGFVWKFPTRYTVSVDARIFRPKVKGVFQLSDLKVYKRAPSDLRNNDLPSREVRVNLNAGKLGSLLAMAAQALRKR